ncbi:MAG: helix-turn-helix domain-containing protein [Micrococcales bacterium]|nr:helix-turn-helix domain-containing protein [Micrococcales bacterium]
MELDVARTAADWAAATGISAAVFGFAERALVRVAGFCPAGCPLAAAGRCDAQVAHRFGCYEAERWDGQYIYYCPASLIFVATLVCEGDGTPSHGVVAGPLVMGAIEDLLADVDPRLASALTDLPARSPAEVGALARVQGALCRTLRAPWAPDRVAMPSDATLRPPSDEPGRRLPDEPAGSSSDEPVPAASDEPALGDAARRYPFHVERQLVGMIHHGDRAGAAELINQLLSVLYLSTNGSVPRLRQGAAELITLFSRAAIEGGADADAIFGEKQVLDQRLARAQTLDELSVFLVRVFNRFVGYVFDFSQFQHANTLRQIVGYVRTHYAQRVTLADAARQVWLSPSYLSSVFSSEMKTSFTAYVQSVRIEKSKDLLLGTHRSIADIAAATGFSDQSYFTKVFTRATGTSPTQFRRQQARSNG